MVSLAEGCGFDEDKAFPADDSCIEGIVVETVGVEVCESCEPMIAVGLEETTLSAVLEGPIDSDNKLSEL
jgi:hypothetical protein